MGLVRLDDEWYDGKVQSMKDAHAARFHYDVAAIFPDIRAMQKNSGLYYVRHPGRPAVASAPRNDLGGNGLEAPAIDSDL